MATSNFYTKNASKIYAVLLSQVDGDEVYPADEFELEALIESIHIHLPDYDRTNERDNNRNYSGNYVAEKSVYKDYGDVEIGFTLKVVIRGAYYEGATLDWELLDYNESGYSMDEAIECAKDELEYSSDMNNGLIEIQKGLIGRWMKSAIEYETEELERVFEKLSTPLQVAARFSNGETMYKSA